MTSFTPSVEAVHTGRVRPVARRNVRPRRTGSQPPEYPVQNPPVINPGHSANLRRQQRLNHRPLEIRQIKACHQLLPSEETLNQSLLLLGILFYGYVT